MALCITIKTLRISDMVTYFVGIAHFIDEIATVTLTFCNSMTVLRIYAYCRVLIFGLPLQLHGRFIPYLNYQVLLASQDLGDPIMMFVKILFIPLTSFYLIENARSDMDYIQYFILYSLV